MPSCVLSAAARRCLLIAGLGSLWSRSRSSRSRGTQRRVRFLVLVGALAVLATLADFLWFLDLYIPPIGAATEPHAAA